MKLKTILLILTGLCVGVMMQDSISQLRWRNVAIGGELFFFPMVILLVWFGWTLRSEYRNVAKVRRIKNGTTRRE